VRFDGPIVPKNDAKAQRLIADNGGMKPRLACQIASAYYYKAVYQSVRTCCAHYSFLVVFVRLFFSGYRLVLKCMACILLAATFGMLSIPVLASGYGITYATRMDSVAWSFSGSKFGCQLMHYVDSFGMALFERNAGGKTAFTLTSISPRMKAGPASLSSRPPPWGNGIRPERLAIIDVSRGLTPIKVAYKTTERMLAELQKGMDLQFAREPWYGDDQKLTVVVPSLGFRKSYNDYLRCLGSLLPVSFEQIEKRSLYYAPDNKKGIDKASRNYLDKVAIYVSEDPEVKVIYIDGHTDSKGVRSENLLKSKVKAEKIAQYLLDAGVDPHLLMTRWHGERYQVESNQNAKGRAKNTKKMFACWQVPVVLLFA